MKRFLAILLIIALLIIGCKKEIPVNEIDEKASLEEKARQIQQVPSTDDEVGAVSSSIDGINEMEQDLDTQELDDLDSGFEDVQNI